VKATRFESPKAVAALRRRLAGLLAAHPDDLQVVREAVARAYVAEPRAPAAAILASLDATAFTFDRRTLARLRALGTHADTVAALRALLAPRVVAVDPAEGAAAPEPRNLYVACSEPGPHAGAQCRGGKLAVPADRLDDLFDILAADVRNPGKAGLLTAVSAGAFEPLSFIRRPGEHLSVSVGGS
jgi:hypothetical protein